jgi:hypothetical protein
VAFFMQTLVKKGYMGQARMLRMNQFLMATSSVAAVRVLGGVCLPAAAASVALNLTHGGYELGNTALVAAAAMMWCGSGGGSNKGLGGAVQV